MKRNNAEQIGELIRHYLRQETLGYGLVHRGVLSFSSVLTSVSFQICGHFGKQHLH